MDPGELGLPTGEGRKPGGTVTVKATAEDWDRIIALKHHWEEVTGRALTITDVMRASLRYTVKALDLMPIFAPAPPPADLDAPPAAPPIPASRPDGGDQTIKRSRKKKPQIRKSY